MPSRGLVACAPIREIGKLAPRSLFSRRSHQKRWKRVSDRCRLNVPSFGLSIAQTEGVPAPEEANIAFPVESSFATDELFPTVHAKVASCLSLLRVVVIAAASRGDLDIHHLTAVRTERHRRISTPMIHVVTQTQRHLRSPVLLSVLDPLSRCRVTLAPTDLSRIGVSSCLMVLHRGTSCRGQQGFADFGRFSAASMLSFINSPSGSSNFRLATIERARAESRR